jgi:peptidoglycan/xylan/chitin deacetylase (PgdA/CDA1 family)
VGAERRVAITVDVEGDYGGTSLHGVDRVLPAVLDLFDELGARATLFVVGDVARARKDVLRSASERGHVVGSHSMTHAVLGRIPPARRRAEIVDSRAAIEDVVGAPCEAFRAPFFDAPPDLGPLLDEAGYRWSSSKAPFSPVAFYRHLLATRRVHVLAGSRVIEVPVPGIFGLPIPDGLSYRRLLFPLTALGSPPRVFYFHPYELLEDLDGFSLPATMRPFVAFRRGAWARTHLFQLLRSWKADGVVFAPPRLEVGA